MEFPSPHGPRLGASSSLRHCNDDPERVGGAACFALLEVAFDPAHLIGHVREAKHRLARGARECIERCGLHLDCEQSLFLHRSGHLGRLAERGIGRPGGAAGQRIPQVVECALRVASGAPSIALYSAGRA